MSFDDDDDDGGGGGGATAEEACRPDRPSSPSDSQTSSPSSDGPSCGRAKRRPPPLYILDSNFTSHGGGGGGGNGEAGKQTHDSPKTSSPTGRKCLVKQSVVCEEASALSGPPGPSDSPKFLIPPGKFDSTPR